MRPMIQAGGMGRRYGPTDPNYASVRLLVPYEMGGNPDGRDFSPNRRAEAYVSGTSGPGKFGGTAVSNLVSTYGSAADWKFLHDGTSWTIDGWIDASLTVREIIDTGNGTSASSGIYMLLNVSRQINIQIYRGVGGSFVLNGTTSGALANTSAFQFLRMTWDHSLGSANFAAYVDGVSIGTLNKTGNAPSASNPASALDIGRFSPGSGSPLARMDDFRITEGVILSGSEVPTRRVATC